MDEEFCRDGFVALRGAVEPAVLAACIAALEAELRTRGVEPRDPATWTAPVVRFNCPSGEAFAAAGNSPAVRAGCDRLLGADRWIERAGVGGTVPVRFPHAADPGDAGWHIDGSYDVDGRWWVNVRSRERGLLALYLFSDVDERSAPTEVLVGSHLDVPAVLAPHGERGLFFGDVSRALPESAFARPRALATGRAGDVFLCHPFLVHRATWPHRGDAPRMVAQPAVALREPFALGDCATCPVERAILDALRKRE